MSGTAGAKVEESKQEYQYSMPFVTPSRHERSFYDTPGNQRVVLKHTSGSHLEFKSDGSVFLKAVKDFHIHGSVLSSEKGGAGGSAKGADASTFRFDKDINVEINGRLQITAKTLEVDIGDTSKIITGTDLIMTGNNIELKGDENIALNGTKSVYVDTKEFKERSVTHICEEGTQEDKGKGGMNIQRVHGNTIIQNDDPEGGITIASKGYLNLVCGQERVDLIGKYVDAPSSEAVGTFTQIVAAPSSAGSLNKSTAPGDKVFVSDAGVSEKIGQTTSGSSADPTAGYSQVVTTGNRVRKVDGGNENVTISGIQVIKATRIFLN